MPITDTERLRLRRMVGDRIPLGGTDNDAFFSNAEIDDLYDEAAGSMNLAALNGWLAKMAEFAKLIDTDISGANRKFSQMFKQAATMAQHYGSLVGGQAEAIVGRVVGRAINLRETPCTRIMPASSGFRLEARNMEARAIMRNSHPDTTEEDSLYPEPGPIAT